MSVYEGVALAVIPTSPREDTVIVVAMVLKTIASSLWRISNAATAPFGRHVTGMPLPRRPNVMGPQSGTTALDAAAPARIQCHSHGPTFMEAIALFLSEHLPFVPEGVADLRPQRITASAAGIVAIAVVGPNN